MRGRNSSVAAAAAAASHTAALSDPSMKSLLIGDLKTLNGMVENPQRFLKESPTSATLDKFVKQ